MTWSVRCRWCLIVCSPCAMTPQLRFKEQACSTCVSFGFFAEQQLERETERLWENWLVTKTAFPSPRCDMSCARLVGAARSRCTQWPMASRAGETGWEISALDCWVPLCPSRLVDDRQKQCKGFVRLLFVVFDVRTNIWIPTPLRLKNCMPAIEKTADHDHWKR